MNAGAVASIGAAALIASAGAWWFAAVAPGLKKLPPIARYGVYAAIWFAYFILSVIVIGQA